MVRKLVPLFVFLLLSASLVSAQDSGKTFVLVHGAFQDSSGWNDVITALEATGNTAIAVNLPGHNEEAAPETLTLDAYRDTVIATIEAQAVPVVLVGHSFGGMVISAVAEAIPTQIETLIYLAAYLPQTGDSLVTLSSLDHYSVLGQEGNFIVAEDFSTGSVNADIFATAFCPDCDEEQLARVAASQIAQPLAALNTSVALTTENFGSVRRAYILTAEDIVVSPQLQAYMLSNTPVERVFALNTGHAPYISAPQALADLLVAATQ